MGTKTTTLEVQLNARDFLVYSKYKGPSTMYLTKLIQYNRNEKNVTTSKIHRPGAYYVYTDHELLEFPAAQQVNCLAARFGRWG
jgi:hypothetical protein